MHHSFTESLEKCAGLQQLSMVSALYRVPILTFILGFCSLCEDIFILFTILKIEPVSNK